MKTPLAETPAPAASFPGVAHRSLSPSRSLTEKADGGPCRPQGCAAEAYQEGKLQIAECGLGVPQDWHMMAIFSRWSADAAVGQCR